MVTRDEAVALAGAWVNGGGGQRLEVGVHEFDLGYVVWGVEPPSADRTVPPSTVGTARGVVDRATGELTMWPPLPVAVIAEQYAARRAAEQRFPADVLEVLRAAGWQPGHRAEAGGDPARAALAEFGGLRLEPKRAYAFSLYPAAGHEPDLELYEGLAENLGLPLTPIGVRHDDGPSELTVDPRGRVFASHWSGSYFVADSADEAIVALIRGVGDTLPQVRADGSFGD
jgi:hypothetical protein